MIKHEFIWRQQDRAYTAVDAVLGGGHILRLEWNEENARMEIELDIPLSEEEAGRLCAQFDLNASCEGETANGSLICLYP